MIETGEGNVHIYLDESAGTEMAVDILLNAKTQRPSVCNTVETLLVHRDAAASADVLAALAGAGVRLHVDQRVAGILPSGVEATTATDEDWAREYMDLDLAVAMVDSMDDALRHIRDLDHGPYRSDHYQRPAQCGAVHRRDRSAAVIVNASTRFTDGGELGLGAEVGISTQKMHARGPMGLRELTTTKWIVRATARSATEPAGGRARFRPESRFHCRNRTMRGSHIPSA